MLKRWSEGRTSQVKNAKGTEPGAVLLFLVPLSSLSLGLSLLLRALENKSRPLSVPLLSLSYIFGRGGHHHPKIPLSNFGHATHLHEP